LRPGESWPILGDFVRLTRVHNPGAAFGLFPQGTVAFLVTSAAVSLALFLYLLFARPTGLQAWGSALILGGAVGNLVDRARLGYVVDLFSVGNFPVFNVADAALVVGVGLLALGLLRGRR
ncbi:MAG: signal peptidase II, partial [Candidatus Bipolaricaulota bacterium]|nr:signal peptidase II [Candidatus Bipolaricaulota bacterium]MDW8127248.1 signal peptidase II [Candidatus Bipolaricaulota bacterium]